MSDVAAAAQTLMASANELDELSKKLMDAELELAPIERDLTEHIADFTAACWTRHVEEDAKLPSAEIRTALAHKSFDRDRFNRCLALRAARARAKGRLSDLKEIVSAQRSILSALKTELEASEGPQPQWSPDR
jgi:hypothetical protein